MLGPYPPRSVSDILPVMYILIKEYRILITVRLGCEVGALQEAMKSIS